MTFWNFLTLFSQLQTKITKLNFTILTYFKISRQCQKTAWICNQIRIRLLILGRIRSCKYRMRNQNAAGEGLFLLEINLMKVISRFSSHHWILSTVKERDNRTAYRQPSKLISSRHNVKRYLHLFFIENLGKYQVIKVTASPDTVHDIKVRF